MPHYTGGMTPRTLFSLPAMALALALAGLAGMAHAQSSAVPYWAALGDDEVNMRVGPSNTYPIDWVYHRKGLPVRVVRVNQGWRLVEDPEGARGWISASLLTRTRGAIVIGEGLAALRAEGNANARMRWNLEPGVVGELGECRTGWCAFAVAGHTGFVDQTRLWGAGAP